MNASSFAPSQDVNYRLFMELMNTLNAEGFHQVGLLNDDIP